MRPPILALVVAASAALLGPPDAAPAHAAEALVADTLPVGPFDRVEFTGHAELVLVQGDKEAVQVAGSPKAHARIRVRSQDGRLRIDASEATSWWSWLGSGGRGPAITVHFRTLESLDMSGAVKVTSVAIHGKTLRISASGATSMKVDALSVESLRFSGSGAVKGEFAGSAAEQEISISGAGAYRAPKLVSERAAVTVSGAGKVVVNARKKLDAAISGAGAIEYYGEPELKQRVTGAGKITRRSSETASPARFHVAAGASGSARARRLESSPA